MAHRGGRRGCRHPGTRTSLHTCTLKTSKASTGFQLLVVDARKGLTVALQGWVRGWVGGGLAHRAAHAAEQSQQRPPAASSVTAQRKF